VLVSGVWGSSVHVPSLFSEAADACREYAVYLSHDSDRARSRGDKEAVKFLHDQWERAHAIADELQRSDPDAVDIGTTGLAEIRGLAAQLVHRLDQLEHPRRRVVSVPVPATGTLAIMATRMAAYLRVSTDRQAEQGLGLDVQREAIEAWARKNRCRIAVWCSDEGRSGAADVIDRPALGQALGAVKAGDVRGIVVARLDRVARDLVLQEWIRAEVLRAGGALRSVDPVEDLYMRDDPDNPTGDLVRKILGAVAEYERAMTRLRMRAGKELKRDRGGYAGGRPPYGYRAIGRQLVPDVDEQRVVSLIRARRRAGKSFRVIASMLANEGFTTRSGKPWSPQAVQRVARHAERPRGRVTRTG
jgi:DNA invertase Pin-like site-specific DNA recombinase